MATRELFLLVLVFILVALSTVMGFQMVQSTHSESIKDSIRSQLLDYAAQAQGWAMRPAFVGGGDRSFSGFNWDVIQVDPNQPDIEYLFLIADSGKTLVLSGVSTQVEDTLSLQVKMPEGIMME
jgi:hypothetical protein